jgi:hypothetical protein
LRDGWEVIGNFTDHAISGSTTMRPGYQALLSAMRSGQIDLEHVHADWKYPQWRR